MLIDVHCHFFTKNVMTESIIKLEGALSRLERLSNPLATKENAQMVTAGKNGLEFINTAIQNTPQEMYEIMKKDYGCDFIAVPLMLDLSYAFLAPNDKAFENKKTLARTLKKISEKRRMNVSNLKLNNIAEFMERKLDIYDRSVLGVDVFQRSYEEQINDLITIKDALPNRVYPFFSIDPRRNEEFSGGVISEIKKYVGKDKSFIGLKLYTSLGYSPTHPVLFEGDDSVYGYCEKNNIPITIHSSLEGFSHMLDQNYVEGDIYYPYSGLPIPALDAYEDGIVKYDKNVRSLIFNEITAERQILLNHPKLWFKVLDKFPDLKINFAHFGGIIQMSKFANDNQTGFWPKYIIELMETYPNVYTDLSCYYNKENNPNYLKDIYHNVYLKLSESVKSRVMYGSDYFMLSLFDTDLKDYIDAFRKAFGNDFKQISEINPIHFLELTLPLRGNVNRSMFK